MNGEGGDSPGDSNVIRGALLVKLSVSEEEARLTPRHSINTGLVANFTCCSEKSVIKPRAASLLVV